MASVPLSGTNIALYSGIPFNSDYKHTRWFDSLSDQLNWFASQTHVASFTQDNFQRAEGKGAILRVKMSVDQLWNVNYISFQNADYAKVFYGFVTEIEYVNNGLTRIHFEIDVLQTWMFDMNFKPSFVAREHCPLWNTDGSPVINTVPEDLNYGAEYETVYINNIQPNNGWKWLVVVAKSTIHAQDATVGIGVTFPAKSIIPTVIGTPQPLSYYLVPFQTNDTVPVVNLSQQANVPVTKPSAFLRGLYLSDNAINNVVSIYVTDHTGIGITSDANSITFNNNNNEIIPVSFTASDSNTYQCLYVQSVWSFDQLSYFAGTKYLGYNTVTESKLMMYPYCVLMLDDFKGSRSTFRNEYIEDTNLTLTVKGSLGTSNKTTYGIQAYNKDPNMTYSSNVNDETALINNNPNDVAILDDNLGAFLQGHRNTIANQKQQILWSGGTQLAGNTLGAIASIASKNPAGAVGSAIGALGGAKQTQLAIAGINAKQEDINNTPPQLMKMGSNTSYDFGNGYNGLYVIKKQIKPEYIQKLTDYFNMYGYKLNDVKIPNFHTRASWNYVQTEGCVIRASINNEDLEELKACFDNGITLWHVDDIGNYTLSNGVIA
jgi:hypothetical protein